MRESRIGWPDVEWESTCETATVRPLLRLSRACAGVRSIGIAHSLGASQRRVAPSGLLYLWVVASDTDCTLITCNQGPCSGWFASAPDLRNSRRPELKRQGGARVAPETGLQSADDSFTYVELLLLT